MLPSALPLLTLVLSILHPTLSAPVIEPQSDWPIPIGSFPDSAPDQGAGAEAGPSRHHPHYTPPQRLFSSVQRGPFKAPPPMPNPNRPIRSTEPGFIPWAAWTNHPPVDTIEIVLPDDGRDQADAPHPTPNVTSHFASPRSGSRRLPSITHVDPTSGAFIDELGRTRVFRGMSISYKIAPFAPELDNFDPVLSFAEDDMRLFDKLNLNIIRLGISWAAVQPVKGPDGFDLEYLSRIKSLVQRCEDAGLYVVIECHQDLFAERFMGDGAPAWAVTRDWSTLPFPMPIHGTKRAVYSANAGPDSAPVNMNYTDYWGFEYGSDAVTRAFWGLYTDDQGTQTEFVRFWGKLAETFKGMNNVVGYGALLRTKSCIVALINRSP